MSQMQLIVTFSLELDGKRDYMMIYLPIGLFVVRFTTFVTLVLIAGNVVPFVKRARPRS